MEQEAIGLDDMGMWTVRGTYVTEEGEERKNAGIPSWSMAG